MDTKKILIVIAIVLGVVVVFAAFSLMNETSDFPVDEYVDEYDDPFDYEPIEEETEELVEEETEELVEGETEEEVEEETLEE
jgi:flagellar basal body-associated protein FliL